MRQLELRLLFEMALKANLRRFFWVENRVMGAAGLIVNAAGAVARFAADVFRVRPLGFQAHVGRGLEITYDLRMTFGAGLRADEFRAGNLRRGDHGARCGGT